MKTIKIAELKTYAELGLLDEINIQESVSGEWLVTFRFKTEKVTGDYELATLETFRGKIRHFKSIDAAHSAIRHIDLGKAIYIQKWDENSKF